MIIKTIFCPDGVELPYKITVDNPRGSIGVFGDSFAQLAEFKKIHKHFDHERSWIYFLANILNMDADTYGMSGSSISDAFYTLENCNVNYDIYILFFATPLRPNLVSNYPYNFKNASRIKELLKDKKALVIYTDKNHKIFEYNALEYVSNFHLTNKNIPDEGYFNIEQNPHDQQGAYHHMSARGNLLLALELSKLLIA